MVMLQKRAYKVRELINSLFRQGWTLKNTSGSHKKFTKQGYRPIGVAIHNNVEVGPAIICKIIKQGNIAI